VCGVKMATNSKNGLEIKALESDFPYSGKLYTPARKFV
jgi:hypothetical protein